MRRNRGSAGIESVLWGLAALVFLLLPIMCFGFELYGYVIEGHTTAKELADTSHALYWRVSTRKLSELTVEFDESVLSKHLLQDLETRWQERGLDNRRPVLDVFQESRQNKQGVNEQWACLKLEVDAEPLTLWGKMAADGKWRIKIEQVLEWPVNR